MIQLEGLDELLRGFQKEKKEVRDAAMKGLKEAALDIIADAKLNLRRNRSVVTGLLRASGKVQQVKRPHPGCRLLRPAEPERLRGIRRVRTQGGTDAAAG